jgi:hypothetical protein
MRPLLGWSRESADAASPHLIEAPLEVRLISAFRNVGETLRFAIVEVLEAAA